MKTLRKDMYKSFASSTGRFLCIVILLMLGSFALIGLKVSGPNMRTTAKHYLKEYNLADLFVIGDYGLDDSDVRVIDKLDSIQNVEYGYLKDVVIKDTETSFRIFSNTEELSQYELVEGSMPTTSEDIAISNIYREEYPIGSTLDIVEKEDMTGENILVHTSFRVVGYVNSVEILSTLNLGQTTVGTGDLKGYGVVTKEAFDSKVYMIGRIQYKDTQDLNPFGSKYDKAMVNHKNELQELLAEQPNVRLQEIKVEYQHSIDEGRDKIQDAKNELANVKEKLADAKQQLADGKGKIQEAKVEIEENQKKLDDAKVEVEFNEATLKKETSKLEEGEKKLKTKEATWNEKNDEVTLASKELSEKEKELNSNLQQLEQGKLGYESGLKELDDNLSQVELLLSQNRLSEQEITELSMKKAYLTSEKTRVNVEYDTFMSEIYTPNKAYIDTLVEQLEGKKLELEAGKKQLTSSKLELESAKKQIIAGKTSIETAKTKILDVKEEIKANEIKLVDARIELESKEKEYQEKKQEYQEKKTEYEDKKAEADIDIAENEEKLNDAQEMLDELDKPVYNLYNRREMHGGEGYKTYESVSKIIDSLSNIFPIFLYFVAALVTFTTMTRFVDDERINSGTLKALGYKNKDIMKKFLLYGFLSSTIGSILGIVLGHTVLPSIVYSAYQNGFSIPKMELHWNINVSIVALILGFISTVVPAYIVAKRELNENPTILLQPKPPTAGSKILLERITPVWNRMSFTHKVTARNIFRYKKRMFMTIFGVCGSVALLFTGFGIQKSIAGINERQFADLIKYDLIVAENKNIDDTEKSEIQNKLQDDDIESYTSIYYEEVKKAAGKSKNDQSIKLIVTQDTDSFSDFIQLIDRNTKEPIALSNNGAVLSERLADLLNIKLGDTITIKNSNNEEIDIVVTDITEMYLGHFIFMSSDTYESYINKEFENNATLVTLHDGSITNTDTEASSFMDLDGVMTVVQNTTLKTQINVIVSSLERIMKVLIIVAVLLSVVILYNLTNINVVERIRELSTIKVLGFYNKEVTMYIYRETIVLSGFGILVGYIFGILLHHYILSTVPPEDVMFNPSRYLITYLIPAIIILLTNIVLGLFINRKLKHVDMLEALKSVE